MFHFDYINDNSYSCDDAESDNVFSDSLSECWYENTCEKEMEIISEENNFVGGFSENSMSNSNLRLYLEIEISKNLRDETNSKQNSFQSSSQSKEFPDSVDFVKALYNRYLCRNPECL
jgi:hypothetical protein